MDVAISSKSNAIIADVLNDYIQHELSAWG